MPLDADRARIFEDELARELPPGHALAGRRARALARREANDDVLVVVDDATYAVVHLTWARHRETDPRWPSCTPITSLADLETDADS